MIQGNVSTVLLKALASKLSYMKKTLCNEFLFGPINILLSVAVSDTIPYTNIDL